MQMTKSQFRCLNMGIEAGLYNGICTPLWGPEQFAGVGLASSDEKDSFDGRTDLITAYCQHFYIAFQRLNLKPDAPAPNIYLTEREKEVLVWAFGGKSNTDIGAILSVSEHAVDFHFRQIFRKLGVNSRRLAIFKARSMGLIRP
jgi:ATP/maltotriose-dependent transcriptional regulator MalT